MLEKLKTENARKIIIIILALFVTITFCLKLDIVNNSDISEITNKTNYIVKLLYKFDYSIDKDIFKSFLLFALLSMFFKKSFFREDIKKNGKKIFKVILSLLFSFFMVFGYSYMKINSWDMIFANTFQLFKAIIVFIGYYILFRAIINYMFDIIISKIEIQEIKESTSKVYNFIFVKHSFIIPLVIILISWLPYLIAYYPGIIMADSSNQIKQYFGIDIPEGGATASANLINENVKITNHHPVLHTIILGSCMQIGRIIGDDNIGVFIYTILQFFLLSSTFAYLINYMKKLQIPNWIRTLTLLFFALIPVFPFYALEITKDVPFTCFVILYLILIYNLIINANAQKCKMKQILSIILLSLLVTLFRNNGIYVIALSLPFIAIIDKLNRKNILIASVVIIVIYKLIQSVLFPILQITPSGIRESLSIPFQQTARYVKEHGNELTEKEKNVIDKVLKYNTLSSRYNPVHADAVKNEYNKDATTENLVEYFKVWVSELVKHPTTYIQATMNNTYGYFYPETKVKEFTVGYTINVDKRLNETGNFNYHYIGKLKPIREFISSELKIIQKLPGFSRVINKAFNTWIIILLFIYLLYSKRYRYIIYLMPFVTIILVCIASPVNAYFRYTLPFIFGMPLTIAIFMDILKNNNK
mgnify:CR=1 FL=1